MRIRVALLLAAAAVPVICTIAAWVVLTLAAVVRGQVSKCPKCFSTRIRGALEKMQDRFLPGFVSPCRCESCRKRFYRMQPVDYRRRAVSR